jgi:hypothetical protein
MLIFTILFFSKILCSEIIKLEFKEINKDFISYDHDDIINNLRKNILQIDLIVGTPEKKLNIILRFDSYIFALPSEKVNGNFEKLSESSSTLIKNSENRTFINQYFTEGYLCEENFKFKNLNGKNIKINHFNFIYISELCSEFPGILGLNIKPKPTDYIDDYNFINALKKLNIINSHFFTIIYENNKGQIIIGNRPDVYDKRYKKEHFIYFKSYYFEWGLKFNFIYINEKKILIKENEFSGLKIESRINSAPEYYKSYFDELFKNYISQGLCFSKYTLSNYTYFYYCKTNKLENFTSFYFEIEYPKFNFSLDRDDLFEKINDLYYFTIILRKSDKNWYFGKAFFQKYQFIFDHDKKIIGIYTKIEKKSSIGYILIILLIIIILILIFIIFRNLRKIPKYSKASELIEDTLLSNENKNNN